MIKDLKFKSPESEGVRSSDILRFIRYVEENKLNLHSFLFAKGGNIIAEGYFPPFDESFVHRLYSASKTFVALAIGMLVTEGRLKVTDKVISFFPELDTPEVSDLMRECTVEDALTMSIPKYSYAPPELPEPVENRFAFECEKPAGTIFNYGEGTAICTELVERVAGERLSDYMRPLFDKIGVGREIYCLENYDGVSWGASGMMCTLRDFAKVAELVGNRGMHGTEQLIDREYMELMTSVRISTVTGSLYSELKTSGYGYQTWITPRAICMRGMGSQEAFYFTEGDFLFVCNADTTTDGDFTDHRLYDAVKYMIYENIGEPTDDSDAYRELCRKLKSLHLPYYGEAYSPIEKEICDRVYTLSENKMGWREFSLKLGEDEGVITYLKDGGEKSIRFGIGKYLKTTFPETGYYDRRRGVPSGREMTCLNIAEWIEEKKLLLRVYITDVSFGSMFGVIAFKDDKVALQLNKHGQFILDGYSGTASGKMREEE